MLRKISIICTLAIGLSACKIGSLDDPIIIANVDREFEIELWELLSKEDRKLVFRVNSLEEENCLNSTVSTNAFFGQRSIQISIDDIITPSDCIEGRAPAKTEIDASLVKAGIYNLTIDLKKTIVNEGQLIANNNSYEVSMFSSKGIQIPHNTLLSVPNDIMWGFIHYNTPDQLEAAQNFVTELEKNNEVINIKDGYYGYFTQDDGQLSVLDQPNTRTLPFLFTQKMTPQSIQAFVGKLQANFKEELSIQILNSVGEVWQSK